MISENQIDILALVESEAIDSDYLISELHKVNINYKKHEMYPVNNGIMLLARNDIRISTLREEKHYSAFKIYSNNDMFLLFAIHLTSAMYKSEDARNERAKNISKLFEIIEKDTFENTSYKSIVVGDFNLHPFSTGIIGAHGFNATLSSVRAKGISRKIDGEEKFFYYNPMWKLMGDNEIVQGTYYTDNDENDKSFYWYTFDQILLRPLLIEQFSIKALKIINSVNGNTLVKNHRIDKKNYSDHLPIKFEIV